MRRTLSGAAIAIVSILGAGTPRASADVITIDFEGMDSMTSISRNPIPQTARLFDQLLPTLGVLFSSGSPYVGVVNLGSGHATSGENGIGGSTSEGILTYDSAFPILARFFEPSHPDSPAVTNFVAVRIDQLGTSGLSVRLNAFDIQGSLIASATSPDVGGSTLEVSAVGIHSVEFVGTVDEGGAALDDFTFNQLTTTPNHTVPDQASGLGLLGSSLVALWLARKRCVTARV